MKRSTYARIAMTAAVYTAVSLALTPITYGPIQIRIAESLTLLPLIWTPGIWGVTLGCFITNLVGAMNGTNVLGILDVFIGTGATLLAAFLTWKLRGRTWKEVPVLSILMPVGINGIVVGMELAAVLYPSNLFAGFWISAAEVALGEAVSVFAGWFLMKALKKTKIFKEEQ